MLKLVLNKTKPIYKFYAGFDDFGIVFDKEFDFITESSLFF